jgi:hypothetical protein
MVNDYIPLLSVHTNKLYRNIPLVQQIIACTEHYQINFLTLKQRIWHLGHGVLTVPTCSICNINSVKWNQYSNTYNQTCGYVCSAVNGHRNVEITAKRIATNMRKFGAKAPAMNKDIVDKATKTKVHRYGTDGGEVWKKKIAQGMIDKYGVDNPSKLDWVNVKKAQKWLDKSQSDINNITKSRQTIWNTNLGVDNPRKIPDIVNRARKSNILKYGSVHPLQNTEIKNKSKQTSMLKYGRDSHTQLHISDYSLAILNSPAALAKMHHEDSQTLSKIAENLNVSLSTVVAYFNKHNIHKKFYPTSQGERDICTLLDLLNISYVCNTKSIIAPLELDIYIPEHKLAIEYCGLYWHSSAHPRITPQYHKHKLDACQQQGIVLLTIFEDEWHNKRNIVESIIKRHVRVSTPNISADECSVSQLTTNQRKKFLDLNHIEGNGMGSITYGLFYKELLVSCVTFIKQPHDTYLLNRYAYSLDIVDGFCKLLDCFCREYNPTMITALLDLRWGNSDICVDSRFMLDTTIPPDYYWIVNELRENKYVWRHSGKLKHLSKYDPTKSENINMCVHGYNKIFNCGSQRWIYKYLK